MKRSIRQRYLAAVIAVVLLIAGSGCDPITLSTGTFAVLSNAGSWVSGFLTGTLSTLSQTGATCYLNGVQVDCSEIPSGS